MHKRAEDGDNSGTVGRGETDSTGTNLRDLLGKFGGAARI